MSQVYSYSNAEEIEGLTMRNDSPEKAGPAENTKSEFGKKVRQRLQNHPAVTFGDVNIFLF